MSIKSYILGIRKELNEKINQDSQCREYIEELDSQSSDISQTFNKIQSLEEDFPDETERGEMMMTLNETMEDLNKLNKLTQEDYEDYICQTEKFKKFKERYPGLFKMFLSGNVNDSALNHCLNTFSLYETGSISIEQGKEMGWRKFHNLQ